MFKGPSMARVILTISITLAFGYGITFLQKDYAQTAQACGKLLVTLINEVLDQTKIEAGKLQPEAVSFEIQSILDDVIFLFFDKARHKGVEVITNLVDNSVKIQGLGDAQKQLYMPFMQADSSTSQNYGGAGIGLSISRCLVELMGGQIGFVSRPQIGSTFSFTSVFKISSNVRQPDMVLVDKDTWLSSEDGDSKPKGHKFKLPKMILIATKITMPVTRLRRQKAEGFADRVIMKPLRAKMIAACLQQVLGRL
ncbi:hypothetical protein LguiB_026711 [Lonicera macranthoides]